MQVNHVVELLNREWDLAQHTWINRVESAFLDVGGIFKGGSSDYYIRINTAVQSLPALLRGGFFSVLSRVSLDMLLADRKLHQRVVPLDKVVQGFGAGIARNLLGDVSSPEALDRIPILAAMKKPFSFSLPKNSNDVLGKLYGPILLIIAAIIDAVIFAACIVATIVAISILQEMVEEVLLDALPQDQRRQRQNVTISRRI